MRADGHTHTTHSDGSCSPEELVRLAAECGLTGLAITDHDSLSAYRVAAPVAAACGIQLLSGVELTTVYERKSIHLLGYAFDPESASLERFVATHRERRLVRNKAILELLRAQGMPLEESDVMQSGAWVAYGRPHIALAMIRKGYVKSVAEAFERYIGEYKPCYVPGERWTTQESIAAVHEAGGKAVLAHPHVVGSAQLVQKLLELPFDGLEAKYCQFSAAKNQRWVNEAAGRGLFVTGGSDFHGSVKPEVPLGCSLMPEETWQLLWRHMHE